MSVVIIVGIVRAAVVVIVAVMAVIVVVPVGMISVIIIVVVRTPWIPVGRIITPVPRRMPYHIGGCIDVSYDRP